MIDYLRPMAIFAAVVDHGSFRGAAAALGLAPSRVSKAVSDLEQELGLTLIYRTTRKISLTEEGQFLYGRMREILEISTDALDQMSQLDGASSGRLKIVVPTFSTQTELMDVIAEFQLNNPQVSLTCQFSDRIERLPTADYDLAIRATTRKTTQENLDVLWYSDRLLVASPTLIEKTQLPDHPKQLKQWAWIKYELRDERLDFYDQEEAKTSISGQNAITVDNADALYQLALRGVGLTPLPAHLARKAIERNELVHVLPKWNLVPIAFCAEWPDPLHRRSVANAFVKHVKKRMAD